MKNYSLLILSFLFIFSMNFTSCGKDDDTNNNGQQNPDIEELSSEKQILTFIFQPENIEGIIDEENKTISATIPSIIDFTLTPEITISESASISPASDIEQDFSQDIVYTVTAEDGSEENYTATVTQLVPSEAIINSFIFKASNTALNEDAIGTIDQDLKTIEVTVPFGTDVTALTSELVMTNAESYVPGGPQDFTNPVVFTVTAMDGETTVEYTVTVIIEEGSSEKLITSFIFTNGNNTGLGTDVIAAIDESAKTITATVPFGTDVTTLVPTILLSANATVSPDSDVTNNFSSLTNYTVTAEDSSSVTYEVTVSIANDPSAKQITSFVFTASNNTGITTDVTAVIDDNTKIIVATVPYHVSIEALIPTIIHSGKSINPGNEVARNFNPIAGVTYTITAEDNSTVDYNVIVEIENVEREVLVAIYNANPTSNLDDFGWDEMIADPNIDLKDWADNNPDCGVLFQAITGHRLRITRLSLISMAITTIPAKIEDLLFLDSLHLRNDANSPANERNNIISLPSEIENLEFLNVLNVSQNLNFNSIPSSIGNLPNLRYLYLDNTALSTIPSQIGNIASLWYIQLNDNDNLSSLPSQIGNIPGLRGIFLNNNPSLNSIPNEICDLGDGGTIIELTNTPATCN